MPPSLFSCVQSSWRPGIGDPTAWGWVTVLSYLCAAALCALAARRGRRQDGREHAFWLALTLLLALLAVNKQLDLQSALTALAKCHAQAAGWYERRRGLQLAFIIGVIGLASLGTFAGAFLLRRRLRSLAPALLGTGVLLGFVAARAASFHHVDALLGASILGVSFNAAWEVGGIALIGLGAVRYRPAR